MRRIVGDGASIYTVGSALPLRLISSSRHLSRRSRVGGPRVRAGDRRDRARVRSAAERYRSPPPDGGGSTIPLKAAGDFSTRGRRGGRGGGPRDDGSRAATRSRGDCARKKRDLRTRRKIRRRCRTGACSRRARYRLFVTVPHRHRPS